MRNKLINLAGSTILATAMASIVLTAMPQAAIAAPTTEDFETFAAGTPLVDHNGWTFTGAGNYDVGIDATGITGQSARISNAIMSGSFSDWLFSPELSEPATELGAQKSFTAEFEIASATGEYQPGMQMTVAPQTADGARMSNLRFTDTPDGIEVMFSDVLNLDEVAGYYPDEEDWRSDTIAVLSHTAPHHVKIVLDLYDGPHNDVVQVYIDGSAGLVAGRPTGETQFEGFFAPVDNQPTINKAKAGQAIPMKWKLGTQSFATSWEDYYRYNTESNGGDKVEPFEGAPFGTRNVDSLIFQARCDGVGTCENPLIEEDGGFLIDDVAYESTSARTLPIATTPVTDPSVYGTGEVGNPVFTTKASLASECSPLAGDIDPLEVYAPGASGLTYNAATGVWHYNVQTPKSYAGKCVEMTLNGFDESAQFKFVK